MPLSSNLNTYADIAAVLEPVANAGGRASYELESRGQAIRWRQRAYKYRELLQKQLLHDAGSVVQPRTPYDAMRMNIVGKAVEIDMVPEPQGRLHLPTGEVFKPLVGRTQDLSPAPRPLPAQAPVKALTELELIAAQLLAEEGDDD